MDDLKNWIGYIPAINLMAIVVVGFWGIRTMSEAAKNAMQALTAMQTQLNANTERSVRSEVKTEEYGRRIENLEQHGSVHAAKLESQVDSVSKALDTLRQQFEDSLQRSSYKGD